MATAYPGGIDAWSNPTSTTLLSDTGYEHDLVHSNVIDAVEAIETELGTTPKGSAATVKARVDNLEPRSFSWPATGIYYRGQPASSAASTFALVANTLYLCPFYVTSSATTAALSIEVTTFVAGNVRLGLYQGTWGSGGLVPGSLVVDAGTASTGTSNGYKDVTVAQALTGDTWYFTACVSDATATVRSVAYGSVASPFTVDGTNANKIGGSFTQSLTYGALPGTTSSLSEGTQSAIVAVLL